MTIGNIMDTIGTLATQFIKGLSEVWNWLINTNIPIINIPVISVFGAGFLVLIAYSAIRSVTI